MSDKSTSRRFGRTVLAVAVALFSMRASAWGLPAIPDALRDPLFTRAPVLDHGPALPGESSPVECPAAADLKRPLSLSDAIDLGLCHNPQIQAAWATIKVQAAAVGEARAAYLPTASVTVSKLHTRNQYPGLPDAETDSNGHTINAQVNWRLFDFGERAANREAANRLLEAALRSHDAALQKAMSGIVGAYFDAQNAKGALAARRDASVLAQQVLEATLRRQKKGVAAQSDTLQAITALAKARLAEARAYADEGATRAALLYALGIAPSTALQLVDLKPAAGPHLVEDLTHWLDVAAARHPAILAARAQWEAAQAKIGATRVQGLPTVDATANFYQNGYPNQGIQPMRSNVTTVGLSLTIPLFEGFARTYKVREAQAQAEQSEAQLRDTEQQVLTDIIKVHAAAVSAATELQASDALLRAARASVSSSQRRYDKGAADILELLSAQSALADAQQERVRSLTNWESARLRLSAAAGTLNESSTHSIQEGGHE